MQPRQHATRRRRGEAIGNSPRLVACRLNAHRSQLSRFQCADHFVLDATKETVMKRMNLRVMGVLLGMTLVAFPAAPAAAQSAQPGGNELSGLASVSGTVTSPTPFKA